MTTTDLTGETVPAFDWTAVAPGWDAFRGRAEETVQRVTALALERLALAPGERVLELGCGTGELARRLADAVGPQGEVLATDVASGMVALAERTLADVPHARVAQADAASTGLDPDRFDAAAFVMGLMFVVAQQQAAQELRRVLRPGGRAVVATWAGPERNLWLAGVGMAAMVHGVVPPGPPTEPGGLFSLAQPERLEAVLRAGGFTDVVVDEVPLTVHYPDVDAWFETVSALAGPLSVALAARPEALPAVKETAAGFVAQHLTDEGLVLPGTALVARATR